MLGVAEHRGNPALPQDPKAKSGYVDEDYAIQLIEAQGFQLVASSRSTPTPRTPRTTSRACGRCRPTYRLGDKDRDKYAAIGESDRFTLKFVKPAK